MHPWHTFWVQVCYLGALRLMVQRLAGRVIAVEGEVANLRRQSQDNYLLIKDRDLKSLRMPELGDVVARDSLGSTTWNLVSLNP